MSCCTACSRICLILFTVLFSIVGLLILAAGLLVRYGFIPYIQPYLDQMAKGINNMEGTAIAKNSYSTSTVASGEFPYEVVFTLFVALVSIGTIIAFISILGFLGACCKSKCLLYIYAIFVGLVAAAIIVLSSLLLTGTFNGQIQQQLVTSIEDKYYGLEYSDPHSLAWNFVMINLNCCGVHGYEDFNASKHWQRTVPNETYYLVTPVACCKMNGTFPDVYPLDQQCAIHPLDNTSNWHRGCWNEMIAYVTQYEVYVALVIAGILLIMAFVVLLTCVLGNERNKVHPY